MKCEQCKALNNEKSLGCSICGDSITEEVIIPKGVPIEIEEVKQLQVPDFNKTKKKVFKISIATITVLAIAVLYLVFFFLSNKYRMINSKDACKYQGTST